MCGTWTAKDVLCHLAAVRAVALSALRQEQAGQPVTWPWNAYPDGDAWNQAEVERRREGSVAEIRAELDATLREILGVLESCPDSWNEETSEAGWLVSHEREHVAALQALRTAAR